MLQVTNVFTQVQLQNVRLFNIIIINIQLLAIMFKFDENFARFDIDAAIGVV
jgi:hypothetical protein